MKTQSKLSTRRYAEHLLCCTVFVFLASQKMGGMFVFFGVPLFVFACALKLTKVFLANDKKLFLKDFLYKLSIWLAGFAVIFGVHQYYKQQVKTAVTQTLRKIDSHYAKTGTYPTKAHLDASLLKKHRISYSLRQGKPTLFYTDTFMFYAFYVYDFNTKTWQYIAD